MKTYRVAEVCIILGLNEDENTTLQMADMNTSNANKRIEHEISRISIVINLNTDKYSLRIINHGTRRGASPDLF
jgi:hypothetical protein